MAAWAQGEPSVQGLALFGSQAREKTDPIWGADPQSDWDFHVITSQPQMFLDSSWLRQVTDLNVRAYALRTPRLGAMPKINAILADTEADFVIIPAHVARVAKFSIGLGLHRHSGRVRRNMQDLAIVIRPGWRFLKGCETWEWFYQKVTAEIVDPRLDDAAVRNLAEAFVCDFVWALRKLERGELLAVQRTLHREMAETNFRLLHELKLRRGERSFPEARRFERVSTPDELTKVSVSALPDATSLRQALEHCAETLRSLTRELVGTAWQWPI